MSVGGYARWSGWSMESLMCAILRFLVASVCVYVCTIRINNLNITIFRSWGKYSLCELNWEMRVYINDEYSFLDRHTFSYRLFYAKNAVDIRMRGAWCVSGWLRWWSVCMDETNGMGDKIQNHFINWIRIDACKCNEFYLQKIYVHFQRNLWRVHSDCVRFKNTIQYFTVYSS